MTKSLKDQIKKNKNLISVFILFLMLSFPLIRDICSGYLSYVGLDKQEFILWDYSSKINLFPYKDFFYPYGLARYFRDYSFLFSALYYLMAPLIFTIIYFAFKKLSKQNLLSFFSVLSLYLFIVLFVGFEAFTRYGVFIGFSLLIAYVIFYNISRIRQYFFIGLLIGIALALFIDQGVYLFFSFIFLYLINFLLTKNKKQQINIKRDFYNFILGLAVGVFPLFIFLALTNSFLGFINYFKEVGDISLVAKVPFFSFITSKANIFNLVAIYGSIFFLCFKFFIKKEKINFSSYLQITLLFCILIMEQKSIIRSIDIQITFVSYLLLLVLFLDLKTLFLKNTVKINSNLFLLIPILFSVLFLPINPNTKDNLNYDLFSINFLQVTSGTCMQNNVNTFSTENKEFYNVVQFLRKQPDFNGKVFSFSSGNSFFYILLNQKPPYYNAVFEGSSISSQDKTLKYLKENKPEYIILDTKETSLQDGVPDHIRQPVVYKYILTNFYPIQKIGEFLILKKDEKDFFTSNDLNQAEKYKDFILKVNLYMIPYSEGFYKHKNFEKNIYSTNLGNFSSKNKIIVLESYIDVSRSKLTNIELITKEGYKTKIYLNSCKKNEKCIINLSNIPLFYKERTISSLGIDKDFKGVVKIYENKENYKLW